MWGDFRQLTPNAIPTTLIHDSVVHQSCDYGTKVKVIHLKGKLGIEKFVIWVNSIQLKK